tara:strand:+ start:313 stop:492 length:180 start_codon:yes stop_codon:yes gene_type:complete
MRYTIWKIKGRLRVTKFFIKATAIYIAEGIKDYILNGREREVKNTNNIKNTKDSNGRET